MLPRLRGLRLVLALVALAVPLGLPALGERCLKDWPVVSPPRFVMGRWASEAPTSIRLQTWRQRPSHRLITHVFRTFLAEVMGYEDVDVVYGDDRDSFNVTTIGELISKTAGNATLKGPMVNLEVWVGADDEPRWYSVRSLDVLETGPITDPGRFAWFVPRNPSDRSAGRYSDISWKFFTDPSYVRKFAVSSADFQRLNIAELTRDESGYYCSEVFCENGRYIPKWCEGKACATLFAGYGDITGFVTNHIEELAMFVEVIWVGPHLGNLTSELAKEYKSRGDSQDVVLLSFIPSELAASGVRTNYTVVWFPPCEELASGKVIGCKYGQKRLLKLAWKELQTIAKPAYESIRKVEFLTSDYGDLLRRSQIAGPNGDEEAACGWLKDNEDRWKDWIQNEDEKIILTIGGIFPPLNGSTNPGKGIVVGADLARIAINNNSDILRDYQIKLLVDGSECGADLAVKKFIDYLYDKEHPNLIGILGPACSDPVEPLAKMSKTYNTVVISYSAEGSTFSDRSKYPYFYRTIGENNQYQYVYLQLFQQIGWSQVASLTEDGQRYTEYLSHLQDLLQSHGFQFIANRKFPRNRDSTAMHKYLKELKSKNARIIIGDVDDDTTRSLMCAAYHLDMTAKHGYVWFLPFWPSPQWYEASSINNTSEPRNCTTSQMKEAINGHFSVTHYYFAPENETMQENITVGQWIQKYEKRCTEKGAKPNNYAGFAFDAVWTYAIALDKLVKEKQSHIVTLHSENTTRRFAEIIGETDFYGVSGHVSFNGGPSRPSVIQVVQWINNKTYSVGTYHQNASAPGGGGRLELNKSAIVWLTPDGSVPWDGKETCFLTSVANALDVNCEVAIVIANILLFGIVGIVLAVVVVIKKRQYDLKLQETQKYMKSLGLDLLGAPNISCLDKWEIPREFVVVNRKLGEGAFGTVYGGEANIEDKGWVPVAVKTLKMGSTIEEKLDFLSEAEVMKRLDHKNIVKLIGVCTKNEPVYTVMEFMLYGDLKTYLLARRHLVYERERLAEESDDVSNKRLTSMALDVARALSYLAELKYVHRDVASRNCLVNVSRVVKLGDFGMTRPMLENDYYKFSRKGMLPVRWMSPESLALGVFTPASDVWAYGVLLYEIVTFGSFPFQGLNNNQVLEYVKEGNTISIPKTIKPQLEGLIRSCWNLETKKRPAASEIVEFLANYPRLLSPCIDAPLSSVQIEDSGQMEISLPERLRKCSVSLNFLNKNSGRSHAADAESVLTQETTQAALLDSSGCSTEPLLGTPKPSAGGLGLSKYVTLQHAPSRTSQEHPDDYISEDIEVVSIL